MSSIQLPGLSTGLDTQALIQQLMQVESRRLRTLESSIEQRSETRRAVTELQSKLGTFNSAVSALSDASGLRAYSATSSGDAVSVEASSRAYEGSHSVQVKQLATANRWVHDGLSSESSYVGAGTLILSYNHQEMIIQTTEETTLRDLIGLINNDSDNPGITAGILEYDAGDGNPFHLVLNGADTGAEHQISIRSSNAEIHAAASTLRADGTNAGPATRIESLSDFTEQGIDFKDITEIDIAGSLHDGTAVDASMAVSRHTTLEDLIKQIEQAFDNTVKVTLDEGQLRVIDKTSGASQMTLSLAFRTDTESAGLSFAQTSEGGSINASLDTFDAATFLETQTAQDALVKVDNYPPGEDNWINRSSNTIDNVISGVTLNLHSTTANSEGGYDSLTVNMTRDTAGLRDKMQTMIDAYNAVVMYYDEKTKYDPETNTSGILSREFGLTSIRTLIRNPFMTNAVGFTGSDSFRNPRDIGLSFDADGMLSLDGDTFDEAIQQDYRGVLSLIGSQKTGSTSGGDAAHIKFNDSSRHTQAGSYNVRVEIDAAGTITSALIKRADEDWSQARPAEIFDNYIMGGGGTDPRSPEYDLQLNIDTRQTNRTLETTVQVRQGFAGAISDVVDRATDARTGQVTISRNSIDSQISNIETRIDLEEQRLERVHLRLVARYARLETMLTNIQQQFAGLNMLQSGMG